MPAQTNENGENYADELDYRLWNPQLEMHMSISLDEARGKVITSTNVCRFDGLVTIYLKEGKNDE